MTGSNDKLGTVHHFQHALPRLLLERQITGADHLIHQEDLRLHSGGNRKSQPHQHASRIVADRHIQKVPQLTEVGDRLYLGPDAARCFALQVSAVANVLPAVGLWLES